MKALESALEFSRRGFRVFPVHVKGPQLEEWPERATTDEKTIRSWYDGKFSYCDSFGVCPGRDCVVVDVDVKDGKKGKESLKRLNTDFGLPLKTLTVKTKSGGLHLYYKFPVMPETTYIKSITKWLSLDGIDLRGTKGFVVGPTEDNGYRIIQDLALAPMSDRLIELLPMANVIKERVNTDSASALVSDEASSLRGNIPEKIGLGERHDTLIRLMASWARKISFDNAVILLEEAISRCDQVDSDPIRVEDYMPRLEDTYRKFEPVVEDKLDYLLDSLIYIVSGNRIYDSSKPPNIAISRFAEARNTFANWIIWEENANGGTKPSPAFDRWIKHTKRKTMHHIGYKPINEPSYFDDVLGAEVVNTYRAPSITVPDDVVTVEPFIEFVEFLLEEDSQVFLDWMAHLIQRPYLKMTWAPVIVSTHEGLGKNFLFNILARLLGQWNTKNISAGLFNKTFNTFLVDSVLVLINELEEIDARRRYEIVSKLKSYITESAQTIEPKGVDAYTTEVFSNFILFSNREDAIHLKEDSRRFFVHINYQPPKPQEYYNRLYKWLLKGGYEAIYKLLSERDVSKFPYNGRAPVTESREVMIESGKSNEEQSIAEAIANHDSVFISDIITKDSVQYYVENHLYRGKSISSAHLKHLIKTCFQSVRIPGGGRRSRQVFLAKIAPGSDSSVIIEGPQIKQVVYTCRNHGTYDDMDTSAIQVHYQQVFNTSSKNSALKLVK